MKRRPLPPLIALVVVAGTVRAEERPEPTPDGAAHWAFQRPERPALPRVRRQEVVRTPVDLFIAARLEAGGLDFASEAERSTLIRRVAIDLTGLPPTPDEIEAYLSDRAPDAYERMVDGYLASPRYGERWGKYWLDAAGYADSNGYRHADSNRPLAYRYRDYVIRAHNSDKPFDRFVHEQLAGDELAGFTPDGDVTREMAEPLTATHFLRNSPDGSEGSDGNPDELRLDRYHVLEGVVQNTMNCLLGIRIECARCHDHKFEPISQREYYELQAIFFPAFCPEPFDRWQAPSKRIIAVASAEERKEHERTTGQIQSELKALRKEIESAARPLHRPLIEERLRLQEPGLSEADRVEVLEAWDTPGARRSEEQKALLKKHEKALQVDDKAVAKRFPEFASLLDAKETAIAALEKKMPPPLEKLSVLVETDPEPLPHHLLVRGSYTDYGPEVSPGVPAALSNGENNYRVEPRQPGTISTGRRTALARWLTSVENPLVARVQVNRIWQHHFAKGLVATPDNFGLSGEPPTHPKLLDYLAVEFVQSGWSVKAMHRLILGSAVYRQESAFREGAFAKDPENRWLWRYPLRRLDAEAIRDSMLAVAGTLDRRPFGPYIPVKRIKDGRIIVESTVVEQGGPTVQRRSVYIQQKRTAVLSMLEVFDAPAMVHNCARRNVSTVPLQSLTLLNSTFSVACAEQFALRVLREATGGDDERLSRAYLLAVGRDATAEEKASLKEFLAAERELYSAPALASGGETGGSVPPSRPDAEDRIWTELCQMILASSAFLYIE